MSAPSTTQNNQAEAANSNVREVASDYDSDDSSDSDDDDDETVLENLKTMVLSSPAYRHSRKAFYQAKRVAKQGLVYAGKAAWIGSTSAMVLVLPLVYAIQMEAFANEQAQAMAQQAQAQAGGAPQAGNLSAIPGGGSALVPDN
jgi:import receptor subunit TOM22